MELSNLLPYLRALSQMYQHAHWKSEGKNYYGDHLLFERLYDGVNDEIDVVAEKIIGVSGETDAVNVEGDIETATDLAKTMLEGKDFVSQAINAEKGLIELIGQLMGGEQTDGVEDMLQGIASQHEEHLYLLQQRNKEAVMLWSLCKVANRLDALGMYEEANQIDELLVEAKKKDEKTSKKPPKKWWNKMVKEISKGNPDYSEERVNKTIGDIWYNNLTDEKRKEIREREGKKYAFHSS